MQDDWTVFVAEGTDGLLYFGAAADIDEHLAGLVRKLRHRDCQVAIKAEFYCSEREATAILAGLARHLKRHRLGDQWYDLPLETAISGLSKYHQQIVGGRLDPNLVGERIASGTLRSSLGAL